jgi:hypothetical protein
MCIACAHHMENMKKYVYIKGRVGYVDKYSNFEHTYPQV